MTDGFVEVAINGFWPIRLPEWRARFWHESFDQWEHVRLEHMADNVQPGTVVYDIGAEQGDFSTLYHSWGADLVLVEPSPPYWPLIRQIWEANFDLSDEPIGTFAGFASSTTNLSPEHLDYDPEPFFAQWPNCSEGDGIPEFGFRHLAQQADSTPQVTIDELVARLGPPDIVVMDIEGAEWDALKGASQLLASDHKPIFYISVHPTPLEEWYGIGSADVTDLMERAGYDSVQLTADHEHHMVYTPREQK